MSETHIWTEMVAILDIGHLNTLTLQRLLDSETQHGLRHKQNVTRKERRVRVGDDAREYHSVLLLLRSGG